MLGVTSRLVVTVTVLLLIGCSTTRPLIPTSILYALGLEQAFTDALTAALRQPNMDILYVTGLAPVIDVQHGLNYGSGRSRSLAVGRSIVNLQGDDSRQNLVDDATSQSRTTPLQLNMVAVEKISRFLFSNLTRLDHLAETDLGNRTENVEQLPEERLALVEYVGENPGDSGHNYFRTNPTVPSNLVLMTRYDCSAGCSQGDRSIIVSENS